MSRLWLALPVLMLMLCLPVAPAAASVTWCADDPLIAVEGRLLDIQVQMPVENLLTMRLTMLTVVIPQNVSGQVLVDDVSAFPMTTTISRTGPVWQGQGRLPVLVVVEVLAAASYPVRVVATRLGGPRSPLAGPSMAYGSANARFSLPLSLD